MVLEARIASFGINFSKIQGLQGQSLEIANVALIPAKGLANEKQIGIIWVWYRPVGLVPHPHHFGLAPQRGGGLSGATQAPSNQ